MKWLAKRFKYTRGLRDRVRELEQESHAWEIIVLSLENMVDDYRELETTYTKLTLEEAHDILSACADYHRVLKMMAIADPIQDRILRLMEKYNVTVDRNTVVDEVIREAQRYAEDASRRSGTDTE